MSKPTTHKKTFAADAVTLHLQDPHHPEEEPVEVENGSQEHLELMHSGFSQVPAPGKRSHHAAKKEEE